MANEARQDVDGTALEISGAIAEHDDCCCCDELTCFCDDNPSECEADANRCCGDSCTERPINIIVTFTGVTKCGTECSNGSRCDIDPHGGSDCCDAELVDGSFACTHRFSCFWSFLPDAGSCGASPGVSIDTPPAGGCAAGEYGISVGASVRKNSISRSVFGSQTICYSAVSGCGLCDNGPYSGFTNQESCDGDSGDSICQSSTGSATVTLI